jgi:hypothetical protein
MGEVLGNINGGMANGERQHKLSEMDASNHGRIKR